MPKVSDSSVQVAPLSMAICPNSTIVVPSADSVPLAVPDSSSSVLTTDAPIVLPPETLPEKIAPGAATTRSAKPGLTGSKAKSVPPTEPRFTSVVW